MFHDRETSQRVLTWKIIDARAVSRSYRGSGSCKQKKAGAQLELPIDSDAEKLGQCSAVAFKRSGASEEKLLSPPSGTFRALLETARYPALPHSQEPTLRHLLLQRLFTSRERRDGP